VTITGTSGSITKTTTVTLTVTGGPLPAGWADLDIGPVGPAGSASFSNGTFTVIGSGQFVWSTADGFNFAYQSLPGDGTIVARVLSASGGATGQSVGLMIREALTPGFRQRLCPVRRRQFPNLSHRPQRHRRRHQFGRQHHPGHFALLDQAGAQR